MADKLKITLVKSTSVLFRNIRKTVEALGLRKTEQDSGNAG